MWYRLLLIVIILVTAAGNLLVCLAIARERKLQNTTNYFLMSLSIADCLVAILVMPMGMVSEVLGYFPLPHYACVVFATMDVLCCTSSIWHMSTMSMDRYFTIRFPFRYGRNKTRRIMFLKIIAVWAISAAVSSPVFLLGIINKQNVLSNGVCAPNNASFKIYGSIFAFYIPCIIMITTYALTMNSLRNVLVNKEKYDRERRRKQTFRPFAQIIHQYAEIAQGIRRAPLIRKFTSPTVTSASNSNTVADANCHTGKHLRTTKKTISPDRLRSSLSITKDTYENVHQDDSSMGMANGPTINNDPVYFSPRRLTISYIRPVFNKARFDSKPESPINGVQSIPEDDASMSTFNDSTTYVKSRPATHGAVCIDNIDASLTATDDDEQQTTEPKAELEQTNNLYPTTSTTDNTPSIDSQSSNVMVTPSNETNALGPNNLPLQACSSPCFSLSRSVDSVRFIMSWNYYVRLIQSVLQYYMMFYHNRYLRLSIEDSPRASRELFKVHQSTSTSSLCATTIKHFESVSTQTVELVDSAGVHVSIVSENTKHDASNQRRFRFNRSQLPSSSLLINLFRRTQATPGASSGSSSKSSFSSGPRSSAISSSNPARQTIVSNHFCPTGYAIEPSLAIRRRSHTLVSSVSLTQTNYLQKSHALISSHKPLRRWPRHFHSSYVLTNSPKTRPNHCQPGSMTNTASSESSSILHHYSSKLLSNVSNQFRTRDEDIVAANERKALRVLMIIFCVFITSWTPFFICTFISAVCHPCREYLSSSVWFSITWLGYSSSMANPFIYTIFSDAFRRAFVNIICCRPTESFVSAHHTTKPFFQKDSHLQRVHQHLARGRSQNLDLSGGTSTPTARFHQRSFTGKATSIYVNRCVSDTCR